jgi:multidrug efflux pump
MGITVVAGMALGTLFTLLVIPSIYVLIAKQHVAEEEGRTAVRDFDLAEPAAVDFPATAEVAGK